MKDDRPNRQNSFLTHIGLHCKVFVGCSLSTIPTKVTTETNQQLKSQACRKRFSFKTIISNSPKQNKDIWWSRTTRWPDLKFAWNDEPNHTLLGVESVCVTSDWDVPITWVTRALAFYCNRHVCCLGYKGPPFVVCGAERLHQTKVDRSPFLVCGAERLR